MVRRPDQVLIKKKKRTCQLMDFTIPTDQRMKIKKNEKIDKYLKLKKLKTVNVMPTVMSALEMVGKGLEKRLGKLEICCGPVKGPEERHKLRIT